MAISLHFPVHPWFRKTFHDNVVFTKSIFFILGLIFSYKLVEKIFLDILITYLAAWEVYDLRKAVVIVNLQEGTSAILVTFFAYAADVYTGRFRMVVSSTVVCIIGQLLNWVAARNVDQLDLKLFFPALGLITLAQAALTFTLQAFLDDQLRPTDLTGNGRDYTAWRRRSSFWWYFMSFIAAIFVQFGPLASLPLGRMAIVLSALMGFGLLVFSLGTKYYYFVPRIGNPFKDVGTVILGAIAKRKVEYPQTPQELLGNSSGDVDISPRVPWLRWLDRAAIVQEVEASRGSLSNVEQVRRVKLLLKMLPLWSCFLTFSLVAASGSTFFLDEAFHLVFYNDGLNRTPILFFANLLRFTEFVVSEISSYVIRKLRERNKQYKEQKMELVRIGIGLSCCVACCIAAWATAAGRQRQYEEDDYKMNVYLLTPQFLLLGLMGGLARDGLESFYESQVSESLSAYWQPFGEFIMGVGKFLSILCILILSTRRFKWFKNGLQFSRLDKYYILLAVLSFGNVIIYCLVACWYGDDAFLVEEEEEKEEEMFEKERSCGDYAPESSSSQEEEEEETPQDPLLATTSTKNSTYNNYVLLRAVTMFSRLSSNATRKHRLTNQ